VVAGFKQEPLLPLTNLREMRDSRSRGRSAQIYLTRRKFGKTLRLVKPSYQQEDIRVVCYRRPKTLDLPMTAAAHFATASLGHKLKQKILREKP